MLKLFNPLAKLFSFNLGVCGFLGLDLILKACEFMQLPSHLRSIHGESLQGPYLILPVQQQQTLASYSSKPAEDPQPTLARSID